MTIFRRQARAVLDPFSGERPASMTPSSELALTSLVVVALVASAAIISIAALGPQARYSLASVAARPGTLDKAESEVLDLDLYPSCMDVGDGGLPSAPGERAVSPDNTMLQDSADRAFVHGSLASAKGGRATESSP